MTLTWRNIPFPNSVQSKERLLACWRKYVTVFQLLRLFEKCGWSQRQLFVWQVSRNNETSSLVISVITGFTSGSELGPVTNKVGEMDTLIKNLPFTEHTAFMTRTIGGHISACDGRYAKDSNCREVYLSNSVAASRGYFYYDWNSGNFNHIDLSLHFVISTSEL